MSPSPDLQDVAGLLRGGVVAMLALAAGYHGVRLFRRPVQIVDGAHALMGAAMLLMLAGWIGHGAGLVWAAVFVGVGVAGVFSRARVELVLGCAAMVLMLVGTPLSATTGAASRTASVTDATAMTAMNGMSAAVPPTTSSSADAVTLLLVAAFVPALAMVAAVTLLHARAGSAEGSGTGGSPVSGACRAGLSLAAVYMLVMMV